MGWWGCSPVSPLAERPALCGKGVFDMTLFDGGGRRRRFCFRRREGAACFARLTFAFNLAILAAV